MKDKKPKIEDFVIECDTEVGSATVQYKNGGCSISVAEALNLLLLKENLEYLKELYRFAWKTDFGRNDEN